jgi:hypothetical protein
MATATLLALLDARMSKEPQAGPSEALHAGDRDPGGLLAGRLARSPFGPELSSTGRRQRVETSVALCPT